MICHKVVWAGYKLARGKTATGMDLPWRRERTPYRIFLAEMLLIRTRADVVTRIYDDVFRKYPNISELARADENELRTALHPLGLRKRVPYIIKGARYVQEVHDGQIPTEVSELHKIPGLGPYTAPAIATFAYGLPLVPNDVNILRFVSRLTGIAMGHPTKGCKALWELTPLLSESSSGLSAEKLLDFTRLTCRPGRPVCEQCPLTRHCTYLREVQK